MTQYKKKTDFTREQPLHPPKVRQKPNFAVILNARIWNANSYLRIRNVMYKDFTTITSQMLKHLVD